MEGDTCDSETGDDIAVETATGFLGDADVEERSLAPVLLPLVSLKALDPQERVSPVPIEPLRFAQSLEMHDSWCLLHTEAACLVGEQALLQSFPLVLLGHGMKYTYKCSDRLFDCSKLSLYIQKVELLAMGVLLGVIESSPEDLTE